MILKNRLQNLERQSAQTCPACGRARDDSTTILTDSKREVYLSDCAAKAIPGKKHKRWSRRQSGERRSGAFSDPQRGPQMTSYLTPRQLAAQWQVSIKTIYRLVATGKLRAIRLPGSRLLRFDPDQLICCEEKSSMSEALPSARKWKVSPEEIIARRRTREQKKEPSPILLEAYDNALADVWIYQGDAIVVQPTQRIEVGELIAYKLPDGRSFIARCFEKTAHTITIGLQSPINTFELSSIQILGRVLGFDAFAGIGFLALEDEEQTGD